MNRQGLVRVRPNLILIVLLLDPVLILRGRVETHANNRNVERLKFGINVAEPATLLRSARRPREGKKPHDRRVSQEIGLGSRSAIGI